MENFLRGVEDESELGRRLGEEYVCLRESNVPLHTHDEVLDKNSRTKYEAQWFRQKWTNDQEWMLKDKGGADTKLLNSKSESELDTHMVKSRQLTNTSLNYHLPQLGYQQREVPTIPHDNMPPYIEVYIWECREITDVEQELLTASMPFMASPSRP